jgi:hypothetical protein
MLHIEETINNTYWDFHTVKALFPLFLSLPGCTVVDDAKVNESFIRNCQEVIDGFSSLVVVPKRHSSQSWTKVTDELDVYFSVVRLAFHD